MPIAQGPPKIFDIQFFSFFRKTNTKTDFLGPGRYQKEVSTDFVTVADGIMVEKAIMPPYPGKVGGRMQYPD